jgi:hypothetical protein
VPPRIPDDKRTAILADINSGTKGRNQIARDHGVSVGTVTNLAKGSGSTDAFDRSQTKTATAAVTADNRARRVAEAEAAIRDAPAARLQILAADNGRDAQGWAVAYGILIDKHVVLERHDATDPGVMGSLLGTLLDGLQAKHGTGDA